MNKRASFQLAGETVVWFFRIIILVLVLVALAYVVASYINRDVDISTAEHAIFVNKLFYDPDCPFHSGNIDVSHFTEVMLEECAETDSLGVRLTLQYAGKTLTKELNPDVLMHSIGCRVKSDYSCNFYREAVFVLDDELTYEGIVYIEVASKNE